MMPILVKSDDVRRGRKVKVRHGRLRAAQVSMGLTQFPKRGKLNQFPGPRLVYLNNYAGHMRNLKVVWIVGVF